MTRAEIKVPGGKLVRLDREAGEAQVRVTLSGDFFLHPEDGVFRIEETLCRLPGTARESEVRKAVEDTIQRSGLELIGVDVDTIVRLFLESCR